MHNELSFFESVEFEIQFPRDFSAGEINLALRELGYTLCFDVYRYERNDSVPDWQSEEIFTVDLVKDNKTVTAQESADSLLIAYPLATLDVKFIPACIELLFATSNAFEGTIVHEDFEYDELQLKQVLLSYVSALMENWGEEPGSEVLEQMIEDNYGQASS